MKPSATDRPFPEQTEVQVPVAGTDGARRESSALDDTAVNSRVHFKACDLLGVYWAAGTAAATAPRWLSR